MAAELDSTSAAPVLTVLVIIMLLGSFNLQRRCYNMILLCLLRTLRNCQLQFPIAVVLVLLNKWQDHRAK